MKKYIEPNQPIYEGNFTSHHKTKEIYNYHKIEGKTEKLKNERIV